MSKTMADKVKELFEPCSAYSFYAGNGITRSGKTVRCEDHGISSAHEELMKRNANGRCIHARYAYGDGSRLTFKWSEAHGPRMEVTKPKG